MIWLILDVETHNVGKEYILTLLSSFWVCLVPGGYINKRKLVACNI